MSSSPTGSTSGALPRGARAVLLAFAAAAVLLVAFPGALRVVDPDEPRDCEIAREWADGGWTVVPRLNGEPYWSKPPVFHASVGAIMRLTGSREEWTAKVAAGLWGALAVAATAAAGEVLLGPGFGLLAGLLLLGTQYFLLRFRMATTDTAFTALTALSFALLFAARARDRMAWYLLAGAAAGFAAGAKGLHGLLFPLLVGAAVAGRSGRRWAGLGLALAAGAAVFGLWLIALSTGGEGLVRDFLFENAARRFGEEAHHPAEWYHYAVVLLRALPWTFLGMAGAWAAFRGPAADRERLLPAFAWVAVMVGALSLASGKRSVYLLPVLPGAALLAAGAVDAAARGTLPRWGDRMVRWTVEPLALASRAIPWFREGLPRRACGAALAVAVAVAGYAILVVGPRTEAESVAPFALRAAAAAGDRPLVLYRMGQGDVGLFCFPLRRTIPVAGGLADLAPDAAVIARRGAPRPVGARVVLEEGRWVLYVLTPPR